MIEIIKCCKNDKNYIVTLLENPFYIDGKGGQLGDLGKIGDVDILKVLNEKEVLVSKELPLGKYNFKISLERKEDIAEQHSAQHLFSALAFEKNLNTVGFRMAEEYSTVDLDKELSHNELEILEKEVNDCIKKDIPIKEYFLTRDEIEKSGFRKKISPKITENLIRVIEIEGIDKIVCAGYHVKSTKDLRVFKIINFEKIKGNFTRIYFLSGSRAIKDYFFKNDIIKKLTTVFSCKNEEIIEFVDKTITFKKEIENKNRELSLKYVNLLKESLKNEKISINEIDFLVVKEEKNIILELAKIFSENLVFIGIWEDGGLISSKIADCNEILNKIKEKYSIKGGGKRDIVNFKGTLTEEDIIKLL